jgi:hypothetical protein
LASLQLKLLGQEHFDGTGDCDEDALFQAMCDFIPGFESNSTETQVIPCKVFKSVNISRHTLAPEPQLWQYASSSIKRILCISLNASA